SGLSKNDATVVRVVERYLEESSKAAQASPGQLLIHYAPRIPAYMVSLGVCEDFRDIGQVVPSEKLKQTIVLDFAKQLKVLSDKVGFYRNLAPTGDSKRAAYALFDALRWAEDCVPENGQVWIFDPKVMNDRDDELFLALQDRVVRASSGRSAVVYFKPDSGPIFVSAR
ncbi:hypothetical protein EBR21_09650, partial [bacterium]|nr:hypothetical protein [bacterium]